MALDPETILDLVSRYGYLVVFLAGLGEALPLLGFLIPGQAIIILAGAAAAAGALDIWILVLISIPAGIAGDALGFYIGRRYGREFLSRYGPRIGIREAHVAKSNELFLKYGPFALVVARFSFLTRAVGPILGGISGMRPRVFWPFNIVGAVLWSASYAALGYFFGVSFLYLSGTIGRILAGTLLAAVGIVLLYRLLRKYADQFTRDDLYVALLGALAGTVFGVLADRLAEWGAANPLDVHGLAYAERLAPLGPVFGIMEMLTGLEVVGALSLVLLAYLAGRRYTWEAVLVGLGVGGSIVVLALVRPLLARELPDGVALGYPSDQAAVMLVLAGVVTYIAAARSTRPRAPFAAALVGGLFATLAALSRVSQGREPPTAVVGGMAFAVAWLSVSILIVEFGVKRTPRPPPEEVIQD